ncbi:MAG: DUF192 domain-containing protein [Gammaproteobacteria bacterium]|nr:DUF192 domain-containing protein [Gammaproteobacteria bacterium]
MIQGVLLDDLSESVVVGHVRRTTSVFERMRGLLGHAPLTLDHGLWIAPCNSVHTAFMRYPIDLVFLDRALTIVHIEVALPAWRSAWRVRARSTLELAAGGAAAAELVVGQRLRWHAHT